MLQRPSQLITSNYQLIFKDLFSTPNSWKEESLSFSHASLDVLKLLVTIRRFKPTEGEWFRCVRKIKSQKNKSMSVQAPNSVSFLLWTVFESQISRCPPFESLKSLKRSERMPRDMWLVHFCDLSRERRGRVSDETIGVLLNSFNLGESQAYRSMIAYDLWFPSYSPRNIADELR